MLTREHCQALLDRARRDAASRTAAGGVAEQDRDFGFAAELFDPKQFHSLEPIGAGGQGVVFSGVDRARRRVAIKLLMFGAFDEGRRRRFSREIELTGRLRHPNIVRLFEIGEAGGFPFYSMEYVEGGLPIGEYVRDVLAGDPVSTAKLMHRVCQAVAVAHDLGVVHRDLKPGNILVDVHGEPFVCDFGLAKALTPDPGLSAVSMAGEVCGTLAYFSPEQVNDEPVGARSDVYALGVVMFELFTGGLSPYPEAVEPAALRRNIRSFVPPRVSDVLSDWGPMRTRRHDGDLDAVVAKCLAKEPADRYADASALADDLKRFCEGEAVRARSRAVYRLCRAAKRHRYRIASFLLAALLVGAFLVSRYNERHNADTYARGLAAASFNKLGGIQRDFGQLSDAGETFLRTIEMIRNEDPVDLRIISFDGYQQLAEMYYQEGWLEQADEAAVRAQEILGELVRDFPDHGEVNRRRAYGLVLLGRQAYEHKHWKVAAEYFGEAVQLRREALDPADPRSVFSLAFSLNYRGDSLRYAHEYSGAYDCLIEAHDLYLSVEIESAERTIRLARNEINLAAYHYGLRIPDDRGLAEDWLNSAESRVEELRSTSTDRSWDVADLSRRVSALKAWADRNPLAQGE